MTERVSGLAPGAAADALGVSPQTLRRYAGHYERVHGPLPRRDGQRLLTHEALERLRAAQALVQSGQATAFRAALLRLEHGPPPEAAFPAAPPTGDARLDLEAAGRDLAATREELAATRTEVATMREELTALRAEVAAVRADFAEVSEEVAAARRDLEKFLAVLIELGERQARGHAGTHRRLEQLDSDLAALSTTLMDPAQEAIGAFSARQRPWWRFWPGAGRSR